MIHDENMHRLKISYDLDVDHKQHKSFLKSKPMFARCMQGQIYLEASIGVEMRQESLPLLHLLLYSVQLKDQRVFVRETFL